MIERPDIISTVAAALFGLFVVTVFYLGRPVDERRFLLPLALSSYAVKAALVPLYYWALVAAGLDGFAFLDSYEYHLDGIEVAAEFRNGFTYASRAWTTVDPGYPLLTGFVYWVTGPNTLVMRMLNCMFSTFTLLYVYRIARFYFRDDERGENRIARWSCYLVAFLPYSITISINHRKEPIVVLLATFVFLHAARTIRFERGWPFSFACVLTALFAFFFFRSGFVLPFVGILFLCYIATTQSLVRSVSLAIPMLIILLSVEFLVSEDASISFQRSAARLQGKIAGSAELAEVGGLVRFARMTSPLELYKLPLATFLVVILPYPPYFTGSLPSVILSWANLLNLAFLPHMIRGAWAVVRESEWQRRLPLLIYPLIFLILIGATHVGTVRYRETVFPVMLILAAIGLHRRSNLLLNAAVYGALIFMGGVAYFARFA